jgi:dipeptidyl aminopeptidase/acylaminoacyl peptidase
MIHVVEGDPRVPSPQSVELHMALKRLGVPTELFMYPGQGKKFAWRSVLETLEEKK